MSDVPVIITLSRTFAASPARVFDAWLDPALARHFLFATPGGEMLTCDIDARVGARALIVERRPNGDAEHHMQFERIDRPHRLTFLFRACLAGVGATEGKWTRVALDFEPHGTGTTLTLVHEMDLEWTVYEGQTRQGWTMILANLADTIGDKS